ncbi:MAG: hypothetical protein E6727_08575, partial [Lachnospiraceae bacterium]|nr:hypothetical protein [Lachnospiraceae bacterium]MDU2032518.1 hypothetical protein [Lachnospiraceae bacterium]
KIEIGANDRAVYQQSISCFIVYANFDWFLINLYISFILPYSLTSNTSYFQKRGYITSAIHPQHSQRSLSILNNKQIPR